MKFNQLIVSKDFIAAMAVMKERFHFDQNATARLFGMAISIQPTSIPQSEKAVFTYKTSEGRRLKIPVYGRSDGRDSSKVTTLSMRLAFVIFGWIEYPSDIITDCDFTEAELEKIEKAVKGVLQSV